MREGFFSTTGVRGIANADFTPEFAIKLAKSFSTIFNGDIFIAHDTRTAAKMIENATTSALLSTGSKVYRGGLLPTPAVNFAVKHYEFDGGISVTSSHNPPEYIGMKFIISGGMELSPEKADVMEDIFYRESFKTVTWDKISNPIEFPEVKDRYIENLLDFAGVSSDLRVALDCGNGAMCGILPEILKMIGCKVVEINSEPDSFFRGRGAEPNKTALKQLSRIVKEKKCDIGIATDGDGDRCVFVDNTGAILSGDYAGAIFTRYLYSGKKVVTSVATSDIITAVSRNVLFTAVGAASIVDTLIKEKAGFAFEENGGFIFPEYLPARDGAAAALMMIKVLEQNNKPLNILVSELPDIYIFSGKICVDSKGIVMEEIAKILREKHENIIETDGLKVMDSRGSFLIRASGTENVIRIRVFSPDDKYGARLYRKLENLVRNIGQGK